MSDTEKVCKICGRIITNSNNRTGICPKCQKMGSSIALGVVSLVTVTVVKKAIKIVKK